MLIMVTDDIVSSIKTYAWLRKPSNRDVQSIMNWMRAHKPLTHEESRFLEHSDDFVALAGEPENARLEGFVEDTMVWCLPRRIFKASHSTPSLSYLGGQKRNRKSPVLSPSNLLLPPNRKYSAHPNTPTSPMTTLYTSAVCVAFVRLCTSYWFSPQPLYWSARQRCCS